MVIEKTWLHCYDLRTKRQSSKWRNVSLPPANKAQVAKSSLLCSSTALDQHCHALPKGITVTANLIPHKDNTSNFGVLEMLSTVTIHRLGLRCGTPTFSLFPKQRTEVMGQQLYCTAMNSLWSFQKTFYDNAYSCLLFLDSFMVWLWLMCG